MSKDLEARKPARPTQELRRIKNLPSLKHSVSGEIVAKGEVGNTTGYQIMKSFKMVTIAATVSEEPASPDSGLVTFHGLPRLRLGILKHR